MTLKDTIARFLPQTIFGQSLLAFLLNTLIVIILFSFLFLTLEQRQFLTKINDQLKSDANIIASKIEIALYTDNKAMVTDVIDDFQKKDYIADIFIYDKNAILWHTTQQADNKVLPGINMEEIKANFKDSYNMIYMDKKELRYLISKIKLNKIDSILDYEDDKANVNNLLGFIVIQRDNAILIQHAKEIIKILLIISILTIILSILITIYFAKYISNPILTLKDITKKITPDSLELGASIELKGSQEIQELRKAFVELLASIKYFNDALHYEKQQLVSILDGIHDFILIVDMNKSVLYRNPSLQKICNDSKLSQLGCPLPEMLQQKYSELPTAKENGASAVLRLTFEDTCHHRILDIASSEILFDEKPAILAVMRDITEKKRLEEELAKIDKLQAIGVLAGGIAHDFNNILAAILGNIQIARMKLNAGSPADERLEKAEKAITRAVSITKQLLTFAKGGAPVTGSMDIKNVIKETAEFSLRGAKSTFEFYFSPDLWQAKADGGQMSQVFHNLFINANHAMPNGGIITITADNFTLEQNIPDLPLMPGRYVRIAVKDTGTGIAPENINKIFDPFFTTKEMGSGLGLATCFSIMKKHGGYISVSSTIGAGATFTLFLPAIEKHETALVSDEQEHKSKPASSPVSSLKGKKKRILVMDDEPMLRELYVDALGEVGCVVDACKEGDEAIGLYLKEFHSNTPYDLVILDLTIPGGKGGKETSVELLKINPEAKIVVCSGYADSEILANHYNYGFCAQISKPFSGSELRKAVEKILT